MLNAEVNSELPTSKLHFDFRIHPLLQHSALSIQHCPMVHKSDALILRTYKLGKPIGLWYS